MSDPQHTPLQHLEQLVSELRSRVSAQEGLAAELTPLLEEMDRTLGRVSVEAAGSPANSDELYHSLVDRLPIHVTRIDLDGRITFANETFCQLVGRTADELIGRTDYDFSPPQLAAKYQLDNQQVARSGQALHAIEENRLGGRLSYYEVWKLPVYNPAGEVVEIQAVFWDVTEREENRAALARERDLLRTLMDSLPDLIYVKDADGRYLTVNRSLRRLWGNPPLESVVGKTVFEFARADLARHYHQDDQYVLETGRAIVDSEERVVTSSGETRTYSTTKVPLSDAQGQVIGLVGIDRDITRRKQFEEDLRQARQAADSANRAKSDFLANMSHEIRTPLNAVIGMTDLLLAAELGGQHHEYLEIIRDAGESLMVVINDILDFSKIEAGHLQLEVRDFHLPEVVHNATRALQLRARHRKLDLNCQIEASVPEWIRGDSVRIRQVLTNLIGNAIKFTDEGEVAVRVSRVLRDTGEPALQFSVRDTGIGIPADKLDHVFKAFAQADASTTRRYGGTGLGLAICTRLVKAMGGHFQVQSTVGKGSDFTFQIPLVAGSASVPEEPRPTPPPAMALIQAQAAGMNILLAEDSRMNQVLAIGILERGGHSVTVANNGREAIQAFRSRSFDLVLMDIQMPEVDGLQATEAIRDHERATGGHVPIIAMTAHALTGDRERCLAAGMDGDLSKPIRLNDLIGLIRRLNQSPGDTASAAG